MVQGTSSGAGKSVVVSALCRIFRQDGLRVAPFKAQNISNNSFVTAAGGEMGRSQVVQAAAAGLEPTVAMNPVLLKPELGMRAQVIVNGRSVGSRGAGSSLPAECDLWGAVVEALARLRAEYEVVVIEGAGSPAEVNLRARDIVNMEVALHAVAPVLLVGDIDRGGVFASLLGTLELLPPEERALVKGLVINQFRGDRAFLDPLPDMIAERTGVPVVGVIPFMPELQLPEEDAVALDRARPVDGGQETLLTVAFLYLPHISNFDDMDPLRRVPGVDVRIARRPADLEGAHVVVVPGTKSTISDLRWMKSHSLADAVRQAASGGAAVIGICGGFQILGRVLDDPVGADAGTPDREEGLGLLPVDTTFAPDKTTTQVDFRLRPGRGLLQGDGPVRGTGYEIHTGRSDAVPDGEVVPPVRAVTRGAEHSDGAVSADGWVLGTYVHGLFDSAPVSARLLRNVARRHGLPAPDDIAFSMEEEFDRLAAVVRDSLDMEYVYSLMGR